MVETNARSLFLALCAVIAVVMVLSACGGDSGDPVADLDIGTHLVVQVEVIEEIESIDVAGERTYFGLRLRVLDVYWRGEPLGWIVSPPRVATGDVITALMLPKYGYEVKQNYAATLSYGVTTLGYEWRLGTGVDSLGNVITSRNAQTLKEWLAAADASDGDVDPSGALLGELASELELRRNATFEGTPDHELPIGPLLVSIYSAAGLGDRLAEQPSEASATDTFLDVPDVGRVFPAHLEPSTVLEEAATQLGVEWSQLEGMILHGDSVADVKSIGLWFAAVGRTPEFGVDRITGVTIIRSVVPAGLPFELIGWSSTGADEDGRRRWDRALGIVEQSVTADENVYVVIDITSGGAPLVTWLSAEDYFDLVLDMQPILERGETGVGG